MTYDCETWTLLATDIKKAGSLPHEMPMPYSQGLMAGPCEEHRHFLSDRSQSCAGPNHPLSQLTLRTCSQTSQGHTCPPSLAVPHRSATWSPTRPDWEALYVQATLSTGVLTNKARSMVHHLLTSDLRVITTTTQTTTTNDLFRMTANGWIGTIGTMYSI